MKKQANQYKIFLTALLIGLLIYSCANRGVPEGGPKDITPPVVIKEDPSSYTTDFHKKSIKIYFNEFVQLKDMANKFVISPPLKRTPKVYLRPKYIIVDFSDDTLKKSTTYNIDFANAIVDNNEGNPLGYYRYVFSTGKNIDSLQLGGKVIDAKKNLPILGASIFIYENPKDSACINELPSYVAKTDSSGIFKVTNIKNSSYKIIAIVDEDKNYKFTPEGEYVGYIDSLIQPYCFPAIKQDTFRKIDKIVNNDTIMVDSIVNKGVIAYGPSDLIIKMFDETRTQLYMTDNSRDEREVLNFIFSVPGENKFAIKLLDTIANNWYLPEINKTQDTLKLWIIDSLIYKKDTLKVKVDYLKTDSIGLRNLVSDTIKFVFKDKRNNLKNKKKNLKFEVRQAKKAKKAVERANKKALKAKRRALKKARQKNQINNVGRILNDSTNTSIKLDSNIITKKDSLLAQEDSLLSQKNKVPIEFLKATISPSSKDFDIGQNISIVFNKPIIEFQHNNNIKLQEKIDSTFKDIPFKISRDSFNIRKYNIKAKFIPDSTYHLSIDSASIYSYYGKFNNKIENNFKVRREDFYGNIILNVLGTNSKNIIIQIYKSDGSLTVDDKKGKQTKKKVFMEKKSDKDDKEIEILYTKKIAQDGKIKFKLVKEGKYMIRAIIDRNANGKWDTGCLLKHIQPEDIVYLPLELDVKQNFDIEQDFRIK